MCCRGHRPGPGFDHWRRGIIDGAAVEALIAEEPPYAQDAQYYICGPGGMNRARSRRPCGGWMSRPRAFTWRANGGGEARDDGVEGVAGPRRGDPGRPDADRGRCAGTDGAGSGARRGLGAAPTPASPECAAPAGPGWAGGSVHMRARMALDDAEIEAGAVLTCQSVATSAVVALSYD